MLLAIENDRLRQKPRIPDVAHEYNEKQAPCEHGRPYGHTPDATYVASAFASSGGDGQARKLCDSAAGSILFEALETRLKKGCLSSFVAEMSALVTLASELNRIVIGTGDESKVMMQLSGLEPLFSKSAQVWSPCRNRA